MKDVLLVVLAAISLVYARCRLGPAWRADVAWLQQITRLSRPVSGATTYPPAERSQRRICPRADERGAVTTRGDAPAAHPAHRLCILVIAPGSWLLTLAGILLMSRTDAFPFAPSLPTANLAVVFSNPQWVVTGTLCVLAGCLLAFLWLPDCIPAEKRPCAMDGARISAQAARVRRRNGTGKAVVATGLYFYVLCQAPDQRAGLSIIACLVGATALLGWAIHDFSARAATRRSADSPGLAWYEIGAIATTMAGFIALNAHDLHYWLYAYIGDEWQFFDGARGILQGNPANMLSQAGVDFIFPVVNSAYEALFMHVFGPNVIGWRLSSIVSAALPIAPLYWLGKQFGGMAFAIAASLLYASCDLLWAFAHIGYNNNDALLAMVPAAALFYASIRYDRPALLFAAGAVSGAGWYTIYTARLAIGILVLVLLTSFIADRRRTLQRLCLLVTGFVMVVAPLAIDSGAAVLRTMSHNTPGDLGDNPYSLLLPQNTVRALYEFFYNTSTDHYMTGAIFTPVAAAALAIGIAVALQRLDSLAARLMLIWFVVTLLLTTPFNDTTRVSFTRSMIIVPPAALLAALGLCSVVRSVQVGLRGRKETIASVICVASALVTTCALSGYRFYVTMPRTYGTNEMSMAIGVLTANPDTTAILAGHVQNNAICIMLDGYGIDRARVLHFQGDQVTQQCGMPTPELVAPSREVLVLVTDFDRPLIAQCRSGLVRLLLAPDRHRAMYGFQLSVAPFPTATYLARVAATAQHLCPVLPTLPYQ